MKYLSLVLINLTRNKRRTILTTLSITVSVFIFASLISLPGLLDQVLRDRANSLRLICHSKAGFSYMLPEAYRRQIESVPHVEAVAGYSVFMGTYRDPNQQRASSLDPALAASIAPSVEREEHELTPIGFCLPLP